MNILHLISSGGMYGAEAVILNLSHVLQRQGHTSVIASFDNASHQLHERALAEELTSVLIPCKGQFSPLTLQAIRTVVREHGIDVLHAHGYKADLYAWAALRSVGTPLVSTCHTWYDNDLAVRVYGALDRRVLRSFACVVAVSAEVEQRLLTSGVRPDRIRRIRNGVDVQAFSEAARSRASRTAETLRVGLVGRLSREKGVDVFIDAVAQVAEAVPFAEFVVVGEGPDRAELEAKIRAHKLQGRLQLLGHRDAMLPVYAGLDVLVSASRQEGLPVALLEGMASGLAPVVTTVGEVPTVVESESSGILVAPGEAGTLATAMLQVLTDSDLRLRLGASARARIEQEFSADRMAERYGEVYRQAAAGTRAVA